MLPGLLAEKAEDRTSVVAPEIQAEFYDECVLPTAHRLNVGERGHWPASYAAEVNRITLPKGGMAYGSQLVAAEDVEEFGRLVLERVRERSWGADAFYLSQLRGTRARSVHHYADRQAALATYLDYLKVPNIHIEDWWVDCGVELQWPGHVLWWRRDAHWLLLKWCFGLDDSYAGQLARSPSKMAIDRPCQLTEVAGFRFTPSANDRGDSQIVYVQAYNTEKSVTYLLSGDGVAKHLDLRKVLSGSDGASEYAEAVTTMFESAEQLPHDGHARLECRIRLDEAMTSFFHDGPQDLARLVVAFPSSVWWYSDLSYRTLPRAQFAKLTLSVHAGASSCFAWAPSIKLSAGGRTPPSPPSPIACLSASSSPSSGW
jgi:hypothetical protein